MADILTKINAVEMKIESISEWVAEVKKDDTVTQADKDLVEANKAIIVEILSTMNHNVEEYVRKVMEILLTHRPIKKVKIAEPPEFDGSIKIRYTEWKKKIGLWMDYHKDGIATDRDRITIAISYLTGPPAQYVTKYVDKLSSGARIESWSEFIDNLDKVYRQKDEERSAKKC